MTDYKASLISELKTAIDTVTFIRLILSSPDDKSGDLNKITTRLVEVKNKPRLSFLYSHKTKTVTKNFDIEAGVSLISELFGNNFSNCVIFTTENDLSFKRSKKGKILFNKLKPAHADCDFTTNHNLKKIKMIKIENNIYLERLGVVKRGKVFDGMSGKFRQINRFVETIDGLLDGSDLKVKKNLSVYDMGSGKGYLTFAVYDFLVNELKIEADVTGIEYREDLVNICNNIAAECGFENLKFIQGSIGDTAIENCDILIALHACDTATDDAIYKGIISGTEIIIVSPCCHKQIRKQLDITNELKEITKHGILEERMAEMATDTLRSLMLEAHGYKTQIFEYISDEHTHKNIMITGVKRNKITDKYIYLDKIEKLKDFFGIKRFYLEDLFNK
ncbi:MAG: SAM-dependent methyltransferase [Candidatus Delongbacteria bacterium]|nr:SAM-dependent methyltransferase [Candidatus Delongbacteria bacterium]MCG2759855.1 SAM-dependent methyltransferase [Candidatus Delongbacteria bacterium]